MKKTVIAVLLTVVSFFGNAQTNILFPETCNHAHWNVLVWDSFGSPQTPVEYYTCPFCFDGDTLINSQIYQSIFCSDQPAGINYHGAYRKDSTAKKIYIVPEDSTNEYILYDYSKNLGDTVFNVYSEYDLITPTLSHVIIDSIDSVLVNTIYLKRFWHHCYYSSHPSYPIGGGVSQWIEMVGGVGGLLSGVMPVTSSSKDSLSCMGYCDTLYYPNYGVGYCGVFLEVNETDNDTEISIYPNPSSGIFTVSSSLSLSSIEVYNVLGEKVYSSLITNNQTTINLSQAPKGIYFVRVTAEGKSYSQKVVIK